MINLQKQPLGSIKFYKTSVFDRRFINFKDWKTRKYLEYNEDEDELQSGRIYRIKERYVYMCGEKEKS